uniref:Uncharacterized protein n=1 Tax=Trypanosoma vivax (strain Y486) TaxID=1055687 RepID=G0TYL5_TRYVY|nr:hypothetical protein TVY486_0703960 [Trypanosoma vivax Y486]
MCLLWLSRPGGLLALCVCVVVIYRIYVLLAKLLCRLFSTTSRPAPGGRPVIPIRTSHCHTSQSYYSRGYVMPSPLLPHTLCATRLIDARLSFALWAFSSTVNYTMLLAV